MKKLVLYICVCFMLALSSMFLITTKNSPVRHVFASESQQSLQDDISIFIRQPSHSVYYNDKLYFIDESDKLLKVYDNNSDSFLSSYLDLSDYEVVDVCLLSGDLYLMTKHQTQNQIHKINLNSLQMTTLDDIVIENAEGYSYQSFFVQNLTLDTKSYTLFTISGFRLAPKIAIIDNETSSVLNCFDISFGNNIASGVDFIKFLSYQQTAGDAYLIFVYDTTIAYYSLSDLSSITELESNSIQGWSITAIPSDKTRLSQNETITDIGFSQVNSKDYLAIFFHPIENNGDILRLYSFDFKSGTEIITFAAEFSCENSEYANISGNYFAFSNKQQQQLHFNKINEISDDGTQKLLDTKYTINNPQVVFDLFDFTKSTDEQLIYKTTNKNTQLFTDPWGATAAVSIDKLSDVVKIGEITLDNGTKINDYVYCMYTFAGKNYCGFIKTADLDDKQQIVPEDINYAPRLKVWPNTRLYSLPTNVASGQITSSTELISKLIMEIDANFEVQVLDTICGYMANGTKMIKVKVNDNYIGYIEEKCISNPSNIVNYVVTNATIQKDNTVVYHNANTNSTHLSFTLDKGKNVRINGKRNTQTGWTSITFNDEYGNEFTGYIQTDFIKADAWSTLQIVGCVLIAVNIGLLILILMYKKNHLGNHCQKMTNEDISSANEN